MEESRKRCIPEIYLRSQSRDSSKLHSFCCLSIKSYVVVQHVIKIDSNAMIAQNALEDMLPIELQLQTNKHIKFGILGMRILQN